MEVELSLWLLPWIVSGYSSSNHVDILLESLPLCLPIMDSSFFLKT